MEGDGNWTGVDNLDSSIRTSIGVGTTAQTYIRFNGGTDTPTGAINHPNAKVRYYQTNVVGSKTVTTTSPETTIWTEVPNLI